MKKSVCLKRMLVILVFGFHALFAQAVTFYFLPPDNDRWVAGSSYIYDAEKKTTTLMSVDNRCGWFKKTFDSKDDVPDSIMIYLGSKGLDKLDMNGPAADATDPAWIPLKSRLTTTQYFYQDPSSEEGFVFRATAPADLGEEKAGRCSYQMAAFIYDTDRAVNPSFCGVYNDCHPNDNNNGLRRGIVASTLNPETKKPTFAATNGYANWVNAESFNAAFTPKGRYNGKVSNIPRCYDMPFKRAANGTWQFDSDSLRTPENGADRGTNLVGGFFPYILDPAYNKDTDGTVADYTDCPECKTEYTANCFNPMNTDLNTRIPVLEYKEQTYQGLEAFNRANDRLTTGWSNTTPYDAYQAYNVYNCGTPAGQPRPGFDGAKKSTANLSFCFESHAEFTYEKGQEFFFRGDDDIWVFINNQLVIDLGGTHQAAPAFVDLDSIKTPIPLVPGEKYPIDIFFCERLATQSNVRVSTNMYITQKSTFYSDPDNTENWMCAGIASGNDCASKMSGTGSSKREEFCGSALLDPSNGKYTVDFYMINRATADTIYLSQPPAGSISPRAPCQGTGNTFTCYAKDGVGAGSGITIDNAVYSCGGKYKCGGNQKAMDKIDIPPGNYTVYARLTENGKPTANKPLIIDNLRGPIGDARIVWGTLANAGDELLDAYGDITKREQSAIAGKYIPIYVAVGKWEDKGKYTTFEDDYDPADVVTYSLSGINTEDIDIYEIKDGDTTKAIFPRRIPSSGIDTVWIKGSYEMGEQTFEINLSGANAASEETPSLKLSIYQPRLKFVGADGGFDYTINPSGYKIWGEEPPYVGNPLDVYIVAQDTANRPTKPHPYKLCEHCTFTLQEKSFVNTEGNSERIVRGEPLRIVNGRQTIFIRGQDIVEGKDYAKWHITGPSKEFTFAKWDSLQFRGAPVPMPSFSELYDRNGDGIGDSLRIKFNKTFFNAGKIDSSLIPILVEVLWKEGDTVRFHHPDYTVDKLKDGNYVRNNLYKDAFFKDNYAYWKKYLNLKEDDSLIVIADTEFSKNIATAGYNYGKGKVSSYTPFYDKDMCIGGACTIKDTSAFMWSKDGYNADVLDRVPPIVVEAIYEVENRSCGSSKNDPCSEFLKVKFSEPIFAAPGASENPLAIGNPFSYCFEYSQKSKCSKGEGIPSDSSRSQKWDNNLTWKWELPQDIQNSEHIASEAKYIPNNGYSPKDYEENAMNGDNAVNLTYYAYKINEDETTRMPKAGDWIKIRPPKFKIDGTTTVDKGFDVFYDAAGNSAHSRERGVLITGENRYKQDKVVLASISQETSPEDPPFGGVFTDRSKQCYPPGSPQGRTCADWMSKEAKDSAAKYLYDYTKGNVTEFLPIRPADMNSKEVRANFPGSVGAVFSGVGINRINKICQFSGSNDKCLDENGNQLYGEDGKPLTKKSIAKAINLQASVYYHSNLGNYTAHRDPVVANCTDGVFQSGKPTDASYNHIDERNREQENCLSNEFGFYLAWDLKTNKNRFVGTGAYIAITKYFWEIKYKEDPKGSLKSKKYDQREFVELYGVYRTR